MAANRTVTTLGIGLIVFVILSFVLAVTTYLYFQQRTAQQERAEQAEKERNQLKGELAALTEERRRLGEVIGTDKESADSIEAERNDLFQTKFSEFQEDEKSFIKLVESLRTAIGARDETIKKFDNEKSEMGTQNAEALKQANAAKDAAEKALANAEQQRQADAAEFKTRWEEHEKSLGDVKAEHQKALGEKERFQAIVEELKKLGDVLSTDARRKFASQPAEGEAEPWPDRIRLVLNELRSREKTIQDLNKVLAKLRVADKTLQQMVLNATSKDDRIDGFDGRVVAVDELDRSVLLSFTTTSGMRPGLILYVYDPDDPRPRLSARKGVVELIEVEGGTLARARIRRDSTGTPIIPGDAVATSLWEPGAAPEIVIVGFVRMEGSAKQDSAALRGLVERAGASVADTVSPATAFVIDAGPPKATDLIGDRAREWRPPDEARRKKETDRARELGIRVLGLDALLDMLGLDREALENQRLPGVAGAATAPRN